MKRIRMVVMIAIAGSSITLGQVKTPKHTNDSVETQLIALEKQAAEAWKNKNGSFFQSFLSEDTMILGTMGLIDNKSQIVGAISSSNCEVKSYSLNNFRVTMLEKNTAVLTYKATQDVTCNGKPVALTGAEFDLLYSFLRSPGKIISREDLTQAALGRPMSPMDRSIDVHVSNLRRKLGPYDGEQERIKAIRGSGYVYLLPGEQQ